LEIELFFKRVKQNLKIKRFLGRSKNAVLIQVLVAMIADLLLKLTQLTSFCTLSLQQIGRLISVNLTSRRSIFVLLNPDPGRSHIPREHPDQLSMKLSYA